MIQMTAQTRILVAVEAVDFRKGIDGLCGICRRLMREDPYKGCIFAFRNRGGTSIKLLTYDGQGFWLCQKRLSTGRFQWWPKRQDDHVCPLAVHELQLLLWSGNPKDVRVAPVWRQVKPAVPE